MEIKCTPEELKQLMLEVNYKIEKADTNEPTIDIISTGRLSANVILKL
ncbi:hypothetical protein [Megasphaera sueciensis]